MDASKSTVALCLLSLLASSLLAKERPNIAWAFSNNHTQQTTGADGGHLSKLDPMPNIDRRAKEGMHFDHCYAGNFICAPARATILTGKQSRLHDKMDKRGAP